TIPINLLAHEPFRARGMTPTESSAFGRADLKQERLTYRRPRRGGSTMVELSRPAATIPSAIQASVVMLDGMHVGGNEGPHHSGPRSLDVHGAASLRPRPAQSAC